MRRALLSVAVAFSGAAGVAASGWALQAAALPPPKPAARVAADASVWFHDHRLVVDAFHFHGRRRKGACLRGWFAGPEGRTTRGSLLDLSGPILEFPARHRIWRATAQPGKQPGRLLALVGCSGELETVIGAAAQTGGRLTTERSYAAGQPAIALELEAGKGERLTLYVSPRGFRPLVAFVSLDGRQATARLYLTRLTPRFASTFHLPRERRVRRR